MTHEKRAVVIKRLFLLGLAAAIMTGAWFFPVGEKTVLTGQAPPEPLVLDIAHYHLPGDAASDQVGAMLDEIQKSYGVQVKVSHLGPEAVSAEKKTVPPRKPPYVVMSVKELEMYSFQGLQPKPKVEQKVEEILHGLERVGKDWRPKVKGMKPAGS